MQLRKGLVLARLMSFLDVISLIFLGMQLNYVITKYDRIVLLSEKIQSYLMFPMFALIAVSAYLLWNLKLKGLILYYIQFPFRLYLWIFSVGFITLIPEALGYFEDFWFNLLFKACFVMEVVRLYLSIKLHLQLKKETI